MKSKLILTCAMVAILLVMAACSSQVSFSYDVSCDDFTKDQHITKIVVLDVGDSLKVTLCSNPTTGFVWSESAQISDQTVLQQMNHEFVAAEAENIVGGAGKEIWTFKTLKRGSSTISLEYSQPWEGGEKAEWTFAVSVAVK